MINREQRGFVLKEVLGSNPRKRRDRLHIIAEILGIAKNGSLKTQIMYNANLSWAQLNEYLSFLLETKLIAPLKQNEKTGYKMTSKGMRFLQNYAKIRGLLKPRGEHKLKNNPQIYIRNGNCYKTKE